MTSRTARRGDSSSGSSRSSARTPTAPSPTSNKPFAEIDYKTSGGHDSYNAMQLSLTRRSINGVTMNAQYTLGYSTGNTGGSNEALTAAQQRRALDEFDYDNGYNNFDVRHTFNLSALYAIPGATERRSRRLDRRRHRQRAERPAGAGADRPERTSSTSTAQGTTSLNPRGRTHGGDQHAGRRRIAQHAAAGSDSGVDPFIQDGGIIFLNPAAFATPQPGTFGNLERNSIHGPSFRQIDMVVWRSACRWAGRATSSSGWRCSTCSTSMNFTQPGRARCRKRFRRPASRRPKRCSRVSRTPQRRLERSEAHADRRPRSRSRDEPSGPVCDTRELLRRTSQLTAEVAERRREMKTSLRHSRPQAVRLWSCGGRLGFR